MRLFIAVAPSPEVVGAVRRIAKDLRNHFPSARWTHPEDCHLTLAFLGEVDSARIPGIRNAMERACVGVEAFSIQFHGIGAFDSWKVSRAVWLGVARGTDALLRLQGNLQRELKEHEFTLEERSFHPHITLCRFKSRPSAPEMGNFHLMRKVTERAEMNVTEIALFDSKVTPVGPKYSIVERRKLAGP